MKKQSISKTIVISLATIMIFSFTMAAQAVELSEIAPEAVNPLNVPENTKAEGVFFQGGYGIDYIQNGADIFAKVHPGSEVSVEGIQGVGEKLRPRFIAGNPPDVIDNSGANALDTTALVNEGLLLDLAPLMNAPSLDTPGKTFGETLFDNSQNGGVWSGKQYALNVAYVVFGIWYNKALFEEKGWTYPATWDEMLSLCDTIQADGMACWTYQGQYPYYVSFGLLEGMVLKEGGDDVWKAIDNLEPDAWRHEAIVKSIDQIAELHSKGYILPGTEALNHTESQTEWLKGNAAFIPSGTWLENEMRSVIPEGFEMAIAGVPGTGNAVIAEAGEPFIVPAHGKNPEAGMEYLRCLLSKAGAAFFAQEVGSIFPVKGGADGLDISTAMKSALDVVEAAGSDVYGRPKFLAWYNDLSTELENSLGSVITGRMTPEEFIDTVQAAADEVASDPDIPKFTR
ncbi:MAG: carbohydrate ABC transporter, N-acetylglucosamine/diacetylchitobiose-binding protein [bacterium]|nr:carbohydrate ABC transporter, N-acetylglucosamine/diacetylchitobiose-binding protein [bacterium]